MGDNRASLCEMANKPLTEMCIIGVFWRFSSFSPLIYPSEIHVGLI